VRFDPADLVITKTVAPADGVSVGESVSFNIQYQNMGPVTATNVVIDDVIEDSVLGDAWLRDAFFSTEPVTLTPHLHYQWPLGDLAPGQVGSLAFGGTVSESSFWPSETVITNTASIASDVVDLQLGNNHRVVTTTILPGAPVRMVLTANPTSIPVGGNVSLLQAAIYDAWDNPVANGTEVRIETSLGGFPSAGERMLYATDGIATVGLTSGTEAGTAAVTATLDSVVATTQVVFTPQNPHTIVLTADPGEITVGGETSLIEALVIDPFGNPVVDGTSVAFATSHGTIIPLVASTVNGRTNSVLTSGTTAATATVSAFAGAATGTTQVRFVPGEARVRITADPPNLAVGNNSLITVIARDEFGNPVLNGTVVTYTTSMGYFVDSMISTTLGSTFGGAAQVTLSSRDVGAAVVRASVSMHSAAVVVTFSSGEPHSIEIQSVEPAVIQSCEGAGLATVEVLDRFGNRVPDGTVVVFDVIPQGDVEPLDGGRTTNGIAQAIIAAGTVPGPATLFAWP
jgi:adhesin/invasin